MPRKKSTKPTTQVRVTDLKEVVMDRFAHLNITRSYTSLIYGVITVVVLFALVFATVRIFTQHNTPKITEEAPETAQENTNSYVVKEGDSLWTVAEQTYGTGYAWPEIAKANSLSNADHLEAGTKLVLPEKEAVLKSVGATQTVTEKAQTDSAETVVQPSVEKISGDSYVVQRGDTLWNIAERAYNDPYKWSEIAAYNNLENPHLIFSGNTIKLQR